MNTYRAEVIPHPLSPYFVVVANEMDKRKDRVMLVSLGGVGHGGGAGLGARESSRAALPGAGVGAFGEGGGGGGGGATGAAGGAAGSRVEEAGQTGIGTDNGMAQRDWIQRPGWGGRRRAGGRERGRHDARRSSFILAFTFTRTQCFFPFPPPTRHPPNIQTFRVCTEEIHT